MICTGVKTEQAKEAADKAGAQAQQKANQVCYLHL